MASRVKVSCTPIRFPCVVGTEYTYPCNCSQYLECTVSRDDYIIRDCAPGLLWDHLANECRLYKDVVEAGRCKIREPWDRCDDFDNDYDDDFLEAKCLYGSDNGGGGGGSNVSGAQTDDDGGSSNSAAIIGGVCGGIVLVAIIVCAIFYLRYRRNNNKSSSGSSALYNLRQARQQSHAEKDEEIYDVIDDKAIQQPSHFGHSPRYSQGFDNPGLDLRGEKKTAATPSSPSYAVAGAVKASAPKMDTMSSESLQNRYNELNEPKYCDLHGYSNEDGLQPQEDLSRSISVGGKEVPVQDSDGYEIGYPSGSVPRQKKFAVQQTGGTPNYFVLEKRDSEQLYEA